MRASAFPHWLTETLKLSEPYSIPTPFESEPTVVRPEWIDHNGHMNVAYYLLAFDEACGDLLNLIGLTHAHKKANQCATFVGDFHIHYARELLEGDPIRVTNRVIDCDPKRVHFWQEMYHADEGYLAAQSEAISLHIDMTKRRVAPMDADVFAQVQAVQLAHSVLPRPGNLSRVIRINHSSEK